MALAMSEASAIAANPSTSVHPKETTAHPTLPSSYPAWLRTGCEDEWRSTLSVYKELDEIDWKSRSVRLSFCRQDAWFAVNIVDRTVRIVSNCCHLRWCPLCSKARSHFIGDSVTSWVRKHPRPKILTLTLAHSDDSLDSQITRLYSCFRELRRLKSWSRSVRGGIWFFQVKISKESQQWHPHIHIMLDSEYIPHAYLKTLWHRITGDSEIVDIRTIYSPRTAAQYVARYAARPAQLHQLPCHYRLEIMQALHGRRLCGSFGTAKDVDLSGKSPLPPSDTFSVMSWGAVRDMSSHNPSVALLLRHYATGEPLPLSFDFRSLAEQIRPTIPVEDPPARARDPDPLLFSPSDG